MPYTSPFIKFRMEGHFGASGTKTEVWSAGLNIASASLLSTSSSTILAFLTAVSTPVSTFHAAASTAAGTTCFLDSLSGALIGTNGRYALGSLQSTTRYLYGAPVGGTGSNAAPWSQAMAWSLRSAILRGPGSHGRCFYPAISLAPSVITGVLSPANQTSYLAGVQTLINAINVAATANFGANTNVSNVSNIGLGFQSPVTKIGIGGRLDTQESRENKLSEAYVFGNTTIAAAVLEQAEDDFLDRLKEDPDFKDRN